MFWFKKKQPKSILQPLPPPRPARTFDPEPKPVFQHQTTADKLDWFCKKFGYTYWRQRTDQGMAKVGLVSYKGDTYVEQALTTAEAVDKLIKRVTKYHEENA